MIITDSVTYLSSLPMLTSSPKHFVLQILILLTLALIAIPVGIVLIDPNDTFNHHTAFEIASALNQNKHVLISRNYNERMVQKYRVLTKRFDNKIVVLGSSRSRQISSAALGQPILNLNVSGASLEDMIALDFLFRKKNHVKGYVIVLDPLMFSTKNNRFFWKLIFDHDYSLAAKELGISETNISLFWAYKSLILELFTASSIKGTLLFLINNVRGIPAYKPTDSPHAIDKCGIIYSDGNGSPSIQATRKFAINNSPSYFSCHFSPITRFPFPNKSVQIFSIWISNLKSHSVPITIVLPPHNPSYYPLMVSSAPEIAAVEDWIRAFCKKHDIIVIGSFDPEKANALPEDFYDGSHPKQSWFLKTNFRDKGVWNLKQSLPY